MTTDSQTITETLISSFVFPRKQTESLLARLEQYADPQAALGWRPGDGRAHTGWQLMHVGITEEIFATERLAPQKQATWSELFPRFRHGSTPDDNVPTLADIREVLNGARTHLRETLLDLGDERLDDIPEGFKQRGYTLREIISLIAWHEGHHHGQAHITLNLYDAASK